MSLCGARAASERLGAYHAGRQVTFLQWAAQGPQVSAFFICINKGAQLGGPQFPQGQRGCGELILPWYPKSTASFTQGGLRPNQTWRLSRFFVLKNK